MPRLPNLDFTKRYAVDLPNQRLQERSTEVVNPLMKYLLLTRDALRYKPLSPVGKIDANGQPVYDFDRKLPPIPVTAAIIDAYQGNIVGAAQASNFPYSLKAVGPVNAYQIMARTGQLVSPNVELVP